MIELSFSTLKALDYLNKQTNKSVFRGYPAGLMAQLRMQNILFDDKGGIKLQDMSHVHFGEMDMDYSDVIYLPPETLNTRI